MIFFFFNVYELFSGREITRNHNNLQNKEKSLSPSFQRPPQTASKIIYTPQNSIKQDNRYTMHGRLGYVT